MVRDAVFAGSWYPGTRSEVERFFAAAPRASAPPEPALAVLVPHAGWVYSGAIAHETYSRVLVPETAIVLCPNHRAPPPVLAVWDRGSWRTPLGEAPIDEALAARLRREFPGLRADSYPHAREHAVELHVPFLQHFRPGVAIVPIVVGIDDPGELEAFGLAIARSVRAHDRGVLIVASSDMNHFEAADVAATKDKHALERVLALDAAGLLATCEAEDVSMCGVRPCAAAIHAVRALGGARAELVRYGHSGLVSGDDTSVVGYAGVVLR